MNPAFLIPLPFAIMVVLALLWRDKSILGYMGSAAGVITFLIVLQTWISGWQGTSSIQWFNVGGTTFTWTIFIDNISLLLCAIVAGIGSFIFLYSSGYLEPHEDLHRFYAELSLFAAAMLGVCLSANLFQLFFCWELVGVSSYLLIGFWHDRESAIAAARKAFITIIIGDAFLLTGILLLWKTYGTFDIQPILAGAHANTATVVAAFCIIVGAISKSAQFPLHTWLPDAMEGPTPVSAFLHSATMVKAGLFLVVRMLPLIVIAGLSPLLIWIAAITIVISGCCALVENDIKRVLAYSTMNQLAFILLAFGVGAQVAGMYHLLNHSIFKALLFMSAGVIIHIAGTQDMRKMSMPLQKNMLAVCTGIGVLALAGVPIFSGFFSKDAIFEGVLATGNPWLITFFCAAIVLSATYIFRWYFMIFKPEGRLAPVHKEMMIPLPILAFLTTIGGFFMWMFFGWWNEPASLGIASAISIVLVAIGYYVAYMIYYANAWDIESLASSRIADVFRKKFYFDDIYDVLATAVEEIGIVFAWIDDHIINQFLEGTTRFFTGLGAWMRRMISGRPTAYLFAIAIGFILLIVLARFT